MLNDGPQSPFFNVVAIEGNRKLSELSAPDLSDKMAEAVEFAPAGKGISWGIPFEISDSIVLIKDETVTVKVNPFSAKWLVFMHTSDSVEMKRNEGGLYAVPFKGIGQLNEHAAYYVVVYEDGEAVRAPVRQRHQIGMFQQIWGENCVESVACHKPRPLRAHHGQMTKNWGDSQRLTWLEDRGAWINWLWAWENPHPLKKIVGLRFEPVGGMPLILSAVTAGNVAAHPIHWGSRQKAVLTLPGGIRFDPGLSEEGLLSQIQLDLGQVISAQSRLLYPNSEWHTTYNNKLPDISDREILIEYTAHPEARFHLNGGKEIPVADLAQQTARNRFHPVAPAERNVTLRVVEKGTGIPVAVKLHVHGEWGEYCAPADRHRIPNDAWFEDFSVDFVHNGTHNCTYIPGETAIKLPAGKVYIEVSKGFELNDYQLKPVDFYCD